MSAAKDCQRRQAARGEFWWMCDRCQQTWNERNTGSNWRPHHCPERKGRAMGLEAYRHRENHDGHS